MGNFVPCFSHGGSTSQGWTAVPGTTQSSGNPIDVSGADPERERWPVMWIFCSGGTATVLIEANGGQLDSTNNPPSTLWGDISSGGYALTAGTYVAKRLPPQSLYVRTRISAISGATVQSFVPSIYLADGRHVSASHPKISSSAVA